MSGLASLALGGACGVAILALVHGVRALGAGRSRAAAVERVLRAVPANHVLIIGRGRPRPSSVLRAVAARLEAERRSGGAIVPVLVDLRRIRGGGLFVAIAAAIRERLRRSAVPQVVIAGDGFHRLVRELSAVVDELTRKEGRGAAIALLVDHVDLLESADPRTAQRFRSLLMQGFAEHVVCIAAADRISHRWQCETSPWFNVFEEIAV